MDFNTADPLIRWDSYESLSVGGEGRSQGRHEGAGEGQGGGACVPLDHRRPCSLLRCHRPCLLWGPEPLGLWVQGSL